MQPVLFDSSIYITALRTGDEAALSLRRLAVDSPILLSVVLWTKAQLQNGIQATGFINPLVLPSVTWSALLVERERLTGALARSVECLHQCHGLKCIFEVRWQC